MTFVTAVYQDEKIHGLSRVGDANSSQIFMITTSFMILFKIPFLFGTYLKQILNIHFLRGFGEFPHEIEISDFLLYFSVFQFRSSESSWQLSFSSHLILGYY
jgi:hypothetical protein